MTNEKLVRRYLETTMINYYQLLGATEVGLGLLLPRVSPSLAGNATTYAAHGQGLGLPAHAILVLHGGDIATYC